MRQKLNKTDSYSNVRDHSVRSTSQSYYANSEISVGLWSNVALKTNHAELTMLSMKANVDILEFLKVSSKD